MKKKGDIICARVTDQQLKAIQDLMQITRMSASSILREAIRSYGRYCAPMPEHCQAQPLELS
jgi:hypothetical protein